MATRHPSTCGNWTREKEEEEVGRWREGEGGERLRGGEVEEREEVEGWRGGQVKKKKVYCNRCKLINQKKCQLPVVFPMSL